MSSATNNPTLHKHALHVVHGYNEPFLSLSNQYSRALQSDGWRVITVYLTGSANENVRQQTIADQVIFLNLSAGQMKGLKIRLLLRIRKLLQQYDVKLVVAQRYKSVYLALLGSIGLPIPVLGIAHAFGVLHSAGRRRLLHRFESRLTLAGVSESIANEMRTKDKNLRIVCLHNCIDAEQLEPRLLSRAAARQQLHLMDNEFVFANVGRLHDDKDQATIIRAFASIAAQHANAKLLLIGKGKREARYRALVEQLQLQDRILLTGPVPDAATLFKAFDAYVSASDREPFGIVLTEAMLARIPVISTDCGGAPEVLGEHAKYFSRGNAAMLARQMDAMMQQSMAERENLGEQLHSRVHTQFAFSPFCQRLLSLIATMADRP